MKKLLLTAIAVTTAAAVTYGQGTIYVDNTANTGVFNGHGGTAANPVYDPLVTQNGLIFTLDPAAQQGGGSQLLGQDFSWALYAGASAAAVTAAVTANTPLVSGTGAASAGDNAVYGGIQDPTANFYTVPGVVAGTPAFLELFIWEGNTLLSYDVASHTQGEYFGNTGIFQNPTGGAGAPPGLAQNLTGMPDVLLQPVPEPGTLALAALGGASLLMFRRKK